MMGIRRLKFIVYMLLAVAWGNALVAQMTVKQERQPTALVKEVLIGKGILVDNVHFAGIITALGEFENPSAQPFCKSGIVLSTGAAKDMVGPNDNPKTSTVNGSPGDKNLYALAGGRTFDGAKLEFDFKADKDSVSFNFIFASEEYHDYVGSTFNDVFALVVSGPGFGTGKNLAVLPGTTTPITVNSINPNQNRQYYVENNPYSLVGRINETVKANLNQTVLANFEYDGMTKPFSVGFRVVPKQVYHFEIVVSDAGDGTVDSAVLLEGGAFKSLEQQKHVLRRLQLAEQRRQDSLARVQVVADSLAQAQKEQEKKVDDSWGGPFGPADTLMEEAPKHQETPKQEVPIDDLRRSNQARLDSMARTERQLAAQLEADSLRRAQLQEAQRLERHRQDSIYDVQGKQQLLILQERRHQDSLAQVRAAQTKTAALEQHRQDSITQARAAQAKLATPVDQPAPTVTSEIKETILFEATSYFVPADGERRMRELGQMLKAQPELRAGIYLPQGEPNDVLNMRYDMIRFELLKAGAKTDQIFRNGFSFSAPTAPKNIQRAEVWIRKE
jgi:hypothetical protein